MSSSRRRSRARRASATAARRSARCELVVSRRRRRRREPPRCSRPPTAPVSSASASRVVGACGSRSGCSSTADGAHRLEVRARLDACADDRRARSRPRGRAARRDGGDRRGADRRHRARRSSARASAPVSPSKSVTVPWCASRPSRGLSGKRRRLQRVRGRSPPRCAGMRPSGRTRPARGTRSGAAAGSQLAALERLQRFGHRLDAALHVEELDDVFLGEHEQRRQ